MGNVDRQLSLGDILHIWIKGLCDKKPSLAVFRGEDYVDTLTVEKSDDFLRVIYHIDCGARFHFVWDDNVTAVSLIYVFNPDEVRNEGIQLLWVKDCNQASEHLYRLHFHAPWGWMNDPNGICESGGFVHLFYQHYPHARRWNTMHWGHAISHDLINWIHQPIFLLPREELTRDKNKQGGAFSGSAISMADGSLRVFYTDREDDRKPEWEWQMTAASADGLMPDPATPIITTRPAVPGYRKDFRDPYVFRGPDGLYKMLIGGNDRKDGIILLYETEDAAAVRNWRFVGVLHREPLHNSHTAECPCLIALDGEGSGLWVLVIGLVGWRERETRRRNISFALVGTFDGRRFMPKARRELDFGTDCYAFQTFLTQEGPCGIGWAANWTDVYKERDFFSAMTFPRQLLWRDNVLLTPPIPSLKRLRERSVPRDLLSMNEAFPLKDGLAELEIGFSQPRSPFTLEFVHSLIKLDLLYEQETLELIYQQPTKRETPHYRIENVAFTKLHIFIDCGLVEIFIDDGRWCATKRLDSEDPVSAVLLKADKGLLEYARLWDLKPAVTQLRA